MDEPVDRPQQVGRPQVAVRNLGALGDGTRREGREDRVDGAAPRVEGEQLAGEDDRAAVRGKLAVKVVRVRPCAGIRLYETW